ncbi:MAG TPA: four helix bundle protein [Pyrinomonadaceae bacterium]|jgi:four helix bundle protein|nr:four helix bundle protein [Pyrinomonadaceae bacterium]
MSTSFKSYRDLEVWQKAMKFAKRVYQTTQSFPSDERFGLTNQLRRASVSVPSTLAEGHARFGAGEFARFISIAMGSVAELETQILLSADLGYVTVRASNELLGELETIGKMLRGLAKSITKRRNV